MWKQRARGLAGASLLLAACGGSGGAAGDAPLGGGAKSGMAGASGGSEVSATSGGATGSGGDAATKGDSAPRGSGGTMGGSANGGAATGGVASVGGDGAGGSVSGGAAAGGSGGKASGGTGGSANGGSGGAGGATSKPSWSAPQGLVDEFGRLAIGAHVHIVGHKSGNLIHRASADNGKTWSTTNVVSAAAGNFPAMYGGLFAQGTKVYLLTGNGDLASSASVGGRQLSFRKSTDDGVSWSQPLVINSAQSPMYRVRIAANDKYVHVVGTSNPTTDASLWYFRSQDGGSTWTSLELAKNLGVYGGGQTVAVDGASVHVGYTLALNGPGGGPAYYVRSIDNGVSWSQPVVIGESTASSSRQARVQVTAADGRVFACWQREAAMTGAPVPTERIGFNRSLDGGNTWETAQVLPEGYGVDRNHQHVWMAPGGGIHLVWRHGDSSDATPDSAGYLYSPDYGKTWGKFEIAIDTTAMGGTNHPWNIVADANAVHVLTGPDTQMLYASRLLAQ